MPQCSVPGCSRQGSLTFPKSIELRKRWLQAIKRLADDKKAIWEPGQAARVCHGHFDDNDYHSANYYGGKPLNRRLKADAVPHLFGWSTPKCSAAERRRERQQKREELQQQRTEHSLVEVGEEVEVISGEASEVLHETTEDACTHVSSGTQTDSITVCSTVGDNSRFNIENSTDEEIHYYTGLGDRSRFNLVLYSLGDAAYHLNYYKKAIPKISIANQLYLTLMKLRTGHPNRELGFFFQIDERAVANIFITWINFMFHQWNEIDWWPSQELVRYFAPTDFRAKFSKTRVIVDGTEFPIHKPKNPLPQQASFSTYKNKNTMKILVGSTPGGLASYVSPAYCGSASDRQIVERSNLQSLCDPSDEIMADKGFNQAQLFAGEANKLLAAEMR
ncbi:PREDICTED: uncharacterized protein LOC106820842 [Priapulus caudatus]|uniref:Uncharacterized protein LOC106820842 n=1 Tax=Priapulus caudatus TaxID=37621 RepID=A0ABM1FA12_PRICU|nr:PREDICTED: uncharacterized protein LOC106820842 [Priapulus caudatus]